jgi:hypothetical protein
MLRIVFLGLCMFVKNNDGSRTVVIPDLTAPVSMMTPRGPTCVEPHIAYIAAPVAPDNVSCTGCVIQKDEKGNDWQVLYLRGDTVTITGLMDTYDDKGYDLSIPHITTSCNSFNLSIPATATTLSFAKGKLRAIKSDANVVSSVLENKSAGPVKIEVRRGAFVQSMTIEPKGATIEIKISNDYAAGHFKDKARFPVLAENHWLAYYTLSTTPVVCDLPSLSGHGAETTAACSNSGYP